MWTAQLQGEMMYPPPLPHFSGHEAFFRGGGWGVYCEASCTRNFLPSFFTRPIPLEGYFQGWGVGVRKIRPCNNWPKSKDKLHNNSKGLQRTQKSGKTQLTSPVLFSKFGVLQARSIQPNFCLRSLSHGTHNFNSAIH